MDGQTSRSSSTPSTASAPARSASPGSASSTSRPHRSRRQLTVVVEKEQVALLATEAVAFLDRIGEEYPEERARVARAARCAAQVTEPAVPLFRARMIGLGFEPDREMVLLELRENSPTTTRSEDDVPTRPS